MKKIKSMLLVLGMAAILVFAGCSDDDNPVNSGTPCRD